MIILKEKKNQIREGWVSSSRMELFSALKKNINRRMDIFCVGPDRYIIEDARILRPSNETYLFIDKNGFIAGFTVSAVSEKVNKATDSFFNFFIGKIEVQLVIN